MPAASVLRRDTGIPDPHETSRDVALASYTGRTGRTTGSVAADTGSGARVHS